MWRWASGFGPVCSPKVRSCGECARRGGRYPVRAHGVAVGAMRRLHCDARIAVAPRNSLHSLRSLRSNNRGESDERSALRAPTALLRFSSPHKSPRPGTAHRAATLVVFDDEHLGASRQGCGRAGGGANGRRRAAQRPKGHRDAAQAATRRRACRGPSIGATRSVVPAMRGRGAQPPWGREQRRGPWPAGSGRRRLSASACPPAALHARSSARANSRYWRTTNMGRMRSRASRVAPSTMEPMT